jgi:hypothetical protein
VQGNLGQVLQHGVRGNGKGAGHRLFVRAHELQGQHFVIELVWRRSNEPRDTSSQASSHMIATFVRAVDPRLDELKRVLKLMNWPFTSVCGFNLQGNTQDSKRRL